jgi:cell division protein FtsW (lipid II flippase)
VNGRTRKSSAQGSVAATRQTKNSDSGAGRKHKPDHWIFILTALLLVTGLVVVYSISPGLAASQHVSQSYFVTKQLLAVGLGLVTFAVAALIPINLWKKLAMPLLIITLLGCLVVMVTPINALYPAHRWIRFGGFSFQIAELIKLTLLISLASFLSKKYRAGQLADFNAVIKPLLILIVIILLVVGVTAWLSTQMMINVGAMLGLLPLKGITLPLISQGGTSLIFLTAALGVVFTVSRYTSYNATQPDEIPQNRGNSGNSIDGGRQRRPHNPTLVARPRT